MLFLKIGSSKIKTANANFRHFLKEEGIWMIIQLY